MSIICAQKYDLDLTGAIESPSADLPYFVKGTELEADAVTALLATIPAVYGGLPFQRYHLKHQGGGVWDATVSYGKAEQRGLDPSGSGSAGPGGVTTSYAFEVGMTSVNLKVALQLIGAYGFEPPVFDTAINVGKDNEVAGVDIDVPTYTWSETVYLPDSAVTDGYKGNLLTVAAAPVNDGVFRGLAAGEVRFLGCSGSKKGSDEWELTFRFAAQPNRLNMAPPGFDDAIPKDGWDYVWYYFAEQVDTTTNTLVRKPTAAYVVRVYDRSDFTLLGIGS